MENQQQHWDEIFMSRALDLATRGAGKVSPNPMVGSVIVHNEMVIGEGWHQQYGGPHAEVNAIESVHDKSLLNESTVYVTLEPCSHFGKTPPCADLLIENQVKRVVIANVDTNPLVGGRGIKKLISAGIAVTVGIFDREGRQLNKRFFKFIEKKRPYIILKWAETKDGFIARSNHDSKWISNECSRKLVHRWRSEEDAVLIGTATARYDNPRLNVRDWTGRDPLRIVIDRNLTLEKTLNVFDETQRTICYNERQDLKTQNTEWVKIADKPLVEEAVADMFRRQIQSVIVEGGTKTIQSFIDTGLWDEARIFRSPASFREGIRAPKISGKVLEKTPVGNDILLLLKNTSTNSGD